MNTNILSRVNNLSPKPGSFWSEILFRIEINLLPKRILATKTFWGQTFYVYSNDSCTKYIRRYGTLQKNELPLIKFLIENVESNAVFFDIGANYGFYGTLVEEITDNAEIHCFEPPPDIITLLKKNLRKSNSNAHQLAIGDYEGEASYNNTFRSGNSSLANIQSASEGINNTTKIKVHISSLDTFCKTNSIPTIIKIDVEGNELAVLRGAAQLLKKYRPILAIELWNDDVIIKDICTFMQKFNYKSYKLDENGRPHHIHFADIVKVIDGAYGNFIFM